MSARDELKALIDQIPSEKLASVRAAVEAVLHLSGRQSDSAEGESTGRTGAAAAKKYPERTPAGGIITPQ